jgi:hypothetical protein
MICSMKSGFGLAVAFAAGIGAAVMVGMRPQAAHGEKMDDNMAQAAPAHGAAKDAAQAPAKDAHGGAAMPGPRGANWAAVDNMHLYLCAFHVGKDNPKFQVEAHHFCSPAGNDVHQCVVFDGNTPGSKLLGVEYIITEKAYNELPAEEKQYWHPHAYEILSGQLIAPDMPDLGDGAFPGFIRSWGKTWHTWADPSTTIPVGTPRLMWSANGDGQIDPAMVDKRDAKFGIKSADIRKRRGVYGFAVPQLAPPKTMTEPGRMFTPTGADEPVKAGDAGK